MNGRFGLRRASGLSIFLCVAVFALMALLTVVLGAGVYRSVVARAQVNHEARTAVAYVTGKLRAHAGEVRLAKTQDGADMLVLREEIGGRGYETRIYAYGGGLYEVFAAEETKFAPADGQRVAEIDALKVALKENLAEISVTVDGEAYASHVALWGQGFAAQNG